MTDDEQSNDDAGFRTVLAVSADLTIAELRSQLAAGPVQYIARVDADGTGSTRRIDARFEADLAGSDDVETAISLLGDGHVVHVEQRDDVDSAYRARRILSKRSPERVLLLLDGSEPVAVFSLDTASAVIADDEPVLRWVTDMPNDASLMASRLLLAGTTPWLRTRITDALDNAGHSATIPIAALRDRKISFSLIGDNLAFRLPGEDADRAHVDSKFLDPLGPEASYSVQLVPQHAGAAAVDIEVWFDDDENYPDSQRIDFTVIDVPAAEGAAAAAASEVVVTPFAVPPEASIWIRWDDDELAYDVDGVTERHAVAASRGAFEGAELRALLAEVERLSAAYRADDTTPLTLIDDGAALLGFARVGAQLHAMIYGKDEYDVSDEVASRAKLIAGLGRGAEQSPRLRVEDDRLRLPWELFYDHGYAKSAGSKSPRRPESVADVDVDGFWGHRFRIDHPVARGDKLARSPGDHVLATNSVRVTPFVNPAVADDPATSDRLASRNQAMLDALAAAGSEIETVQTDLLSWVTKSAPTDVLYLFGHGTSAAGEDAMGREQSATADEQARLSLGNDDISVADLEAAEPSPPFLAGAPLVLLNACSTMQGDLAYRNPFIDLLYRRWRARAVIGGVASLPATFAVEFADRLLATFAAGNRQLGDCLHVTVRSLLDEGNPYGLLYALHGRSELQVRPPQ